MTTPGYVVGGRYRLVDRISSGGMGSVWLARDLVLDRDVAVKAVAPDGGGRGVDDASVAQQRARTLREARIAARLTHPHAIAVYDVVLDGRGGGGRPWLVMEHLPSRSLAAVVLEEGPLDPLRAAATGAQVAGALAAAHAAGVVHRDVKPGNLLIADDGGSVKITDFGISSAREDVVRGATGLVTGTPAYVAPEVARGTPATGASDVFSLGSTLYTVVEGSPPFGAGEGGAVLRRVVRGEITPPQRCGPLTAVLLDMLDPDPEQRPTMAQARDRLAAVAAGPAATGPTRRRGAVPVWSWVAAAVVAVLALGLAAVLATRSDDTPVAATAAPTSTPAPTTPAPTTAAPTTTTTPPPTTTTPTPTTTTVPPTTTTSPPTTTPPRATAVLTAGAAELAVRSYFALLPGDTGTAYDRLGPQLSAQGFPAYDAFWSGFAGVTLLSVTPSGDGTTVDTTQAFRRGGQTIVENHRLGMTLRDGQVLINTDTLLDTGNQVGVR